MSQTQRLRAKELRRLYQLTGECVELGADTMAWRRHMNEGLLSLLNAQIAVHSESKMVGKPGESGWLVPMLLIDQGWPNQSDRRVFLEFVENDDPDLDGTWCNESLFKGGPARVVRRQRLVDDQAWYRGRFFNDYIRRGHQDQKLLFHHQTGDELHWCILSRGLGEPAFERRQERLLRLFMIEYLRLRQSRLAPRDAPSISDLTPRQRQTLRCLMEGDSEKQIALRLGVSQHTVHGYVKLLHQRFRVASRAELLSCCRNFWPILRQQEIQSRTF